MVEGAKVSVIIPTYNCSKFIVIAIESVLQQTFSNIEILIVDDGSTDETYITVKQYIRRGLIKYLRQDNKGPSSARNLGISKACGEYICFLDADDTFNQSSIQDRLEVYEKYPELGMVFTDLKKIKRKKDEDIICPKSALAEINFVDRIIKNYIKATYGHSYVLDKSIFCELVLCCFVSTITVMIKKRVLENVGYFCDALKIAEDHDLWLRICRQYDIGFLDTCTATYIMHDDGITKNLPLYYDSSIKVRARCMPELPSRHRSILARKLGLYLFHKGFYYYEKELYLEAHSIFWQALKQDPLIIRHYFYSVLTCLPANFIKSIRVLKRSISKYFLRMDKS